MTNNEFNLSEMVCFSLYSASNAIIRKYRPDLDKLDLTYPQFLVMMSLWNKDAVHIIELSDQTLLDASTLTQILKRLETKGFVIKQASKQDERAKVIVLTKSGVLLKKKAAHVLDNMECRMQLTKTEKKQVVTVSKKVLNQLG